MKRIIIYLITLCIFFSKLNAQSNFNSFYQLFRQAVYNNLETKPQDILDLYDKTVSLITKDEKSSDYYINMSKSLYLLGLYFTETKTKELACKYFNNSIEFAQKAISLKPTAEAYVCLAESMAQNCIVQPVTYVLAHGLEVPDIAKKALSLDTKCGAARYLICSVVIYAPKPFQNLSKGKKQILSLLEGNTLDEEDCFNIYRSIGYIYYQEKKTDEAAIWLHKAQMIFPKNRFLVEMLNKKYNQKEFLSIDPVDSILQE